MTSLRFERMNSTKFEKINSNLIKELSTLTQKRVCDKHILGERIDQASHPMPNKTPNIVSIVMESENSQGVCAGCKKILQIREMNNGAENWVSKDCTKLIENEDNKKTVGQIAFPGSYSKIAKVFLMLYIRSFI